MKFEIDGISGILYYFLVFAITEEANKTENRWKCRWWLITWGCISPSPSTDCSSYPGRGSAGPSSRAPRCSPSSCNVTNKKSFAVVVKKRLAINVAGGQSAGRSVGNGQSGIKRKSFARRTGTFAKEGRIVLLKRVFRQFSVGFRAKRLHDQTLLPSRYVFIRETRWEFASETWIT